MGVVLSDAGLYIFTAALPSLVPSLEADAIIAHSCLEYTHMHSCKGSSNNSAAIYRNG